MTIDPASERGARALERLERERIAWFTSVTPDGQPQTLPVWFLWLDGEILVYSFKRAVRNRNIAHNPQVSFHLADDGKGDDLLIIEGEARIDPATPAGKDNPPYLAKYGEWLAQYGWTPEYFSDEYPVPIRLRPTKIRGL